MAAKILKYLWLTLAILALAAAIHKTIIAGIQESYMYFVVCGIAVLFYLYRKNS